MRKSERLRMLEMQVIRLEMHVELLTVCVNNLMESQGMENTELDSGKWYKKE